MYILTCQSNMQAQFKMKIKKSVVKYVLYVGLSVCG